MTNILKSGIVSLFFVMAIMKTATGQTCNDGNPLNADAAFLTQLNEATVYPVQGIRQSPTCAMPNGTTGTYNKTGVWAGTTYPRCNLNVSAILYTSATAAPMTFSLQRAVQTLSKTNLTAIANKKPLVIYVFSFDPSVSPTTLPSLVTTTLSAGNNVLLLAFDYAGAGMDYYAAVADIRLASDLFAIFLNNLIAQKAIAASSTVMIGHSAGAHLAGMTGAQIVGLRGIIGLDPAGPFFDCQPTLGLTPKSAAFVQVLHTDYNQTLHYGTVLTRGHVDYYANYLTSSIQPGCMSTSGPNDYPPRDYACSHFRAFDIFFQALAPTGKCAFKAKPVGKTTATPTTVFDVASMKTLLGATFSMPKTLGNFNILTSSNGTNLCV